MKSVNVQGDNSTDAHPSNYTVKHTLQEPNKTYTYTLCPSQISEVRCISHLSHPTDDSTSGQLLE